MECRAPDTSKQQVSSLGSGRPDIVRRMDSDAASELLLALDNHENRRACATQAYPENSAHPGQREQSRQHRAHFSPVWLVNTIPHSHLKKISALLSECQPEHRNRLNIRHDIPARIIAGSTARALLVARASCGSTTMARHSAGGSTRATCTFLPTCAVATNPPSQQAAALSG